MNDGFNENFDRIDRKLLKALQADAKMSLAQLAERVHLSQAQVHRRVRKLEESGVIRGYAVLADRESLGLGVIAFVGFSLAAEQNRHLRDIERRVDAYDAILEVYAVSGEHDYFIKIVARDLKALSSFLSDELMQIPGVTNVKSTICLEEIKSTTALPIGN
ncbi:MAG TPA: Lrp/AsnC family transcriptional regulator [Burkholderiaceae bacterium]|nr:Lrp/AsnC family transcriptional regulator [Burkholderiaceae bacterium]